MSRECLSIKAGLFKQLLASGDSLRLRVGGQSMLPYLEDGTVVSVRKSVRWREGSVYLFLNPKTGRQVCHRMIGSQFDHLIMKGDNENCTQTVPKEFILGECSGPETDASRPGGKAPGKAGVCVTEILFDRISAEEYWLWHAWTQAEMTVEAGALSGRVGEVEAHPCSRDATSLRPQVDRCAYRMLGNWVFSAYYDAAGQGLRFRCLQDPAWNAHGIATICRLAEAWTPRPNFHKRQMQYLGMYE